MATTTVENYLKKLYTIQQRKLGQLVTTGFLAETMQVTPGTATSMVKELAKSGLVDYVPRKGSRLTDKGEQLALDVLRRHRLVELFLVKVLELDWSEIHAEAENLEHAVSEKLLQRIDDYLGYPTVDPHGDPIPNANGEMPSIELTSLARCNTGSSVTIARILDQNPDFLRHIDRHGLVPGNKVAIRDRDTLADAITIQETRSDSITLGMNAATKILVELS